MRNQDSYGGDHKNNDEGNYIELIKWPLSNNSNFVSSNALQKKLKYNVTAIKA